MNKITIALAFVAVLLTGCSTGKLAKISDEERGELSWKAFCAARGYDFNDNTYPAINEYLDTWCGSAEEEQVFINAGVKPY